MNARSADAEKTRICKGCGREFLANKASQKRVFCGHPCKARYYGTSHMATPEAVERMASALRDRRKTSGYRKRGGKHEHRLVAEQSLGRPLAPGEIVFHKDRSRGNNSPDNLQVFASRSDFARFLYPLIRKG